MSILADVVPDTWDRAGLEARGFTGFTSFATLPFSEIPPTPGVYVVLREVDSYPAFLPKRPHTRPGQDPAYPVPDLQARWLPGVQVVGIGKATKLRKRLKLYAKYGQGRADNHNGGRSVWQLGDADQLVMAWRMCPPGPDGAEAADVEAALIEAFKSSHQGARPFANIINGRRPKPALHS